MTQARKTRPLSGRQRIFVAKLVEGVSDVDAARAAGFSGDKKALARRARVLKARADIKAALAAASTGTQTTTTSPTGTPTAKLPIENDPKARRTMFALLAQDPGNSIRDRLVALTQLARASGDFQRNEELKPGEGDLVDWVPLLPPDAVMEEYEAFCTEFRKRKIQQKIDTIATEQKVLAEESSTAEEKLRAMLDRGWKDG